ncbi:unnamed protein product [Boreogadus saida]
MEEKGFVARNCLPPEPRCPRQGTSASEAGSGQRQGGGFSRQQAAGLRRDTIAGNNPFLLHDVEYLIPVIDQEEDTVQPDIGNSVLTVWNAC